MYSIIVKFDLEGYHKWPKAPEQYKRLESEHGHIFHFEVEIPVEHFDRFIEILEARRILRKDLLGSYGTGGMREEPCNFGGKSCEHLAKFLADTVSNVWKVDALRVVVMEDEFVGAAYTPEVATRLSVSILDKAKLIC